MRRRRPAGTPKRPRRWSGNEPAGAARPLAAGPRRRSGSTCSRSGGSSGRSSGGRGWPSGCSRTASLPTRARGRVPDATWRPASPPRRPPLKALGGAALAPREIEVDGRRTQAPRLRLHGRAAAVAAERGVELQVSLTHSRELAAAAVLAVRRPLTPFRGRPTELATRRITLRREMEAWLEPAYDATGMRAGGRLGDRGAAGALAGADGGGGRGGGRGRRAPWRGPGRSRVVCGKGNNGGDGLVAARLLAETGYEVEALLLWPADELSADATANLERFEGAASEVGAERGRAGARGSRGDRGRDLRHRVLGGAARTRGRRDRGDQRLRRPGRGGRHRLRRGCVDRRGRRGWRSRPTSR